jgi:hypothetical protein
MNSGRSGLSSLPRSLDPSFVQPPFWKKTLAIAEEFIVVRTPRHAITSLGRRGWQLCPKEVHRTQ